MPDTANSAAEANSTSASAAPTTAASPPDIGILLPSGDNSTPTDTKTGENEKNEEGLGQTLTKSQLTGLAAMSITDIDLLRQHLEKDAEDEEVRFYKLILSFIIISLLLQITAGLITIIVAHWRNYYLKHRANRTVRDVCKMLCGCTLREDSAILAKEQFCFGCCTCRTHDEYEYEAIEEYEIWCNEAIKIERGTCEASEILEAVNSSIQNIEERRAVLSRQLANKAITDKESEEKTKELDAQMSTALERKHAYLQHQEKAAVFVKDGKILHERVCDIYKDRTMEKATFWLNAVNYLMYAIAILNALILGLGSFTLKGTGGVATTVSP